MGVPTQGEVYSRLLEHIRKAQDESAMMAHLTRAQGSAKDIALANGWLGISELMNRMAIKITEMAQGRLQ